MSIVIVTLLVLQPSWADRESPARISTNPSRIEVNEGVFTLTVLAESGVPVNTFSGELNFDPAIVAVESINYHSSIANLWVNEPSYDNTKGVVSFVGGTTQVGGFVGNGTLFTITFKTLTDGVTTVGLTKAIMLQHDGFGTPVDLEIPSGSVVTISPQVFIQNSSAEEKTDTEERPATNPVVDEKFDLNGDGTLSFSDIGIMIECMDTNNLRADFDVDGTVDEEDFDLLLNYMNR